MHNNNGKITLTLDNNTALGLWFAVHFLKDEELMKELSVQLIEQQVALPDDETPETMLSFYLPWLMDRGYITEDTRPEVKLELIKGLH